jgi:HAE1 family hydrophobic/amphiphilic exporter-1
MRDRIDRAMALPDDVSRPTVRKFDSSQLPVMFIGFASGWTRCRARVVEDQIVYAERLPASQVNVGGGLEQRVLWARHRP